MVSLSKKKLSDIGFEDILLHSVNVEAGYVNNPKDRGGETNHGITYATAQEWKADLVKLFNWDGTMRNLTREMAMYIYRKGWWERLRGEELLAVHPLVAQRVFDFGINAGRSRAGKAVQIILNVSNRAGLDYKDIGEDGAIGTKTIEALKAFAAKRGAKGLRSFLISMACRHGNHYQEICIKNPTQEEFFNGWQNRLEDDIAMYYDIYRN